MLLVNITVLVPNRRFRAQGGTHVRYEWRRFVALWFSAPTADHTALARVKGLCVVFQVVDYVSYRNHMSAN